MEKNIFLQMKDLLVWFASLPQDTRKRRIVIQSKSHFEDSKTDAVNRRPLKVDIVGGKAQSSF